ncbi:venom carboxylesterase-6-like [Aricia agestis]|uniref:venom carboxylesterase-6-like n=1 Tax=Aricia agestis TaxID=91739 RepID=UPI001C205B5D|nr:venom carboxylesterase-6-like [Aricia agestis]
MRERLGFHLKQPSIEDESPRLGTFILNWLNSFFSDTNPTASCSYGQFQGTYNTTRLGRTFESYRGIPYAEAPVGSMRFQPPKLIQYYRGMVNATKDGKICPQLSSENNTFAFDDMDEDCLFVNVYTPQRSDRKRLLPVFVYIHQSAFYFKNSRSDLYGPDYLLDRDIVFVTFNYRLGTLGYLSTGDELAPGNNGFKDMVTLLKWVKRYIVAFGGNPGSVTVGGYSSGAISIVSLMVSPMAKGLFHRAIAMGGSSTRNNETKTDLYDLAVKQAEIFNCPTENSKVIVECLKEKPWIDYAKTFSQFWAFTNNPSHLWEPIVEKDFGQERFLTMNTIESIRQGKMMNIPLIIGQGTAEEYPFAYPILNNETLLKMANERWDEFASIAFFLPEQNRMKALEVLRTYYIKNEILNNDDESADRLGTIYGDDSTAFPVERLSKLLSIHSRKPVYYYYFTYVGNHSYTEE